MIEVSKEEHIILKLVLEGEDAKGYIQELSAMMAGDVGGMHRQEVNPIHNKIFQELKNI